MDEPMAGTTLSGDEWEQAQYLPGASVATAPFGPEDPKTKKPAVPATTNLGRVLTGDEWEQAQTQSGPQVKALQIPRLPTLAKAPTDLTGTQGRVGGGAKGKALAPFNIADPTTYANPVLRQIVNPALDNPIQTAVTLPALAIPGVGHALGLAMAGSMVHTIASYGFQKAAEMQLSPEDRARAEADPERVSGEAAAVQAAMLGLAPLIHVGVKSMKGPAFGAGMLESGASGVHETMADPSVAPNRTADFPGELNAAHAAYLEDGAHATRGLHHAAPAEGLETTPAGVTLKGTPKPVEGLQAPETAIPGKVTPVGTDPAIGPIERRGELARSVEEYTTKTAAEDEAVLSKARQKAADAIAKADRFRPRRRGATVPFPESEQGAQIIGAAAARHGMPETANPYHPESPLAAEWDQGHAAGAEAEARVRRQLEAGVHPDDIQLPDEASPNEIRPFVPGEVRSVAHGDPALMRKAMFDKLEAPFQGKPPVTVQGTPAETPAYPDGFSMGGALTDNRIPGASEVPKVARGTDVPVPEGATPESVALANALKPSPYRGHSTDALAGAALDAQAALEHAQEAVQHAAQRGLVGERAQLDMENRGTSYSDETEGPTATAEKAVTRAKSRLSQIEREFAMRGVSGDALADVIQGAKEQRAERAGMQSDDALAMHTGADDPFGEQPTSSRGLASVEGTGETKTRGLSAGVQEKAVANTLTTTLGDLPEYRTVNMAEQATRASALLSSDYALARRVALGEVDAPAGLLPEAVFTAVENRAIAEGDVATIRDLATGGLTTEATTMGQRIRALAERDPDSPVSAISRVVDSRSGGVENATRATAEQVNAIKKHLAAIDVTDDALVKLIDSLRC